MLQYTKYIDNENILGLIRRSCNYVDDRLMDHGYRVACMVSQLLEPMDGYNAGEKRDICLLAMLHDIGAYKTEEIAEMVRFETQNIWEHSIYSALFLRYFSPLAKWSDVVLYHHMPWESLKDRADVSDENKELAQMIHITDRIDIYMESESADPIRCAASLELGRGTRFSPRILDLVLSGNLLRSAADTVLNASAEEGGTPPCLRCICELPFSQEDINGYLIMLIFLIDFRSRYTVTHTITTTTISYQLAKRSGLSGEELSQIVCGALLHDLGKIGIPVEILEFPGKLSPQAMNIMRTHINLTEQIFDGDIEDSIQKISLRHHEKLDGSGYPRGLTAKDLSVSQRIVAIADIVSALAGTRSYKKSYSKERIVGILEQMRDSGSIDRTIVDLMIAEFDEIMDLTNLQCQPVITIYETIQDDYSRMLKQFKEESSK